jgi:hypothetical protein
MMPGGARSAALACAAWLLLASGCGSDPSARNTPVAAAELLGIEVSPGDALGWSHRGDLTADLDGDGSAEVAVLTADVQLSAAGAPLWEDGHRWALVIRDGSDTTVAFAAFVPQGFVEVAVLRPSSQGSRDLLLQERTPSQLRSISIGYAGPHRATATSAAYYQLEQWLPNSAALR